MTQLPAVQQTTMSSLDLLEMINEARESNGENAIRRSDFHDRVEDELEGEYYENFVVSNRRGPPTTAFMLSRDQCTLVSMRESKSVRRQVLQKLKSPSLPNFNDPVEAARAWADAREGEQKALAAAEAARPAVEFVDKYVHSESGNKGFRQVAKLIKAKENAFRAFLVEKKILYLLGGEWMPYQNHIDAGRFEVKTGTGGDGAHVFNQAKFTPKGISWIAGLWAQHNLEDGADRG